MSESLRVLICGSRDWDDAGAIAERMDLVPYVLPFVPEVIHGAARGADTLAGELARARGWHVREFPADWDTHGKRAGFLRNIEMLEQQPHVVWAFQKNRSKGTQHTIDQARKRGIKVRVISDERKPTNG